MKIDRKQRVESGRRGGEVVSAIPHVCPHCGLQVNGNVFYYHLKKCKAREDK